MPLENDLYESFRAYGIDSHNRPGTELYLPVDRAFEFLDACVYHDFAAVRVEGFLYRDRVLEPRLDWIADYDVRDLNWADYLRNSNRFVRDILETLKREGADAVTFVLFSEIDYLGIT